MKTEKEFLDNLETAMNTLKDNQNCQSLEEFIEAFNTWVSTMPHFPKGIYYISTMCIVQKNLVIHDPECEEEKEAMFKKDKENLPIAGMGAQKLHNLTAQKALQFMEESQDREQMSVIKELAPAVLKDLFKDKRDDQE